MLVNLEIRISNPSAGSGFDPEFNEGSKFEKIIKIPADWF